MDLSKSKFVQDFGLEGGEVHGAEIVQEGLKDQINSAITDLESEIQQEFKVTSDFTFLSHEISQILNGINRSQGCIRKMVIFIFTTFLSVCISTR